MKLEFLGDALDHFKGSVFEALQSSNILENFLVDGMISDIDNWAPEHLSLYANLLRVKRHQIVEHKAHLDINRKSYFDEIPQSGDLFLDPDTGIKTSPVNEVQKYLKKEELLSLMKSQKQRVVAVYQHKSRKDLKLRVDDILKYLRLGEPDCNCLSYLAGNVALLFFCFQPERIEAIRGHFHKFLGSRSDNRVGLWI